MLPAQSIGPIPTIKSNIASSKSNIAASFFNATLSKSSRQIIRLICLSLSAFYLSGCLNSLPTIPTFQSKEKKIAEWVNEGNWIKAREEILALPDGLERNNRLTVLDNLINAEQERDKAFKNSQTDPWKNTESMEIVLEKAWKDIDQHEARKRLIRQDKSAAKRVNDLTIQELERRLLWVDTQIELEQYIVNNTTTKQNKKRLKTLYNDRARITNRLLDQAQLAAKFENKKSIERLHAFMKARKLSPKQTKKLAKLGNSVQNLQAKSDLMEEKILLTLLDDAIKEGDFQKARTLTDMLKEHPDKLDSTVLRLKQLDRIFSEQAYLLDKKADESYSQRKLIEATTYWELALQLDKNNKNIKEKLTRAEKVLQRLESIRVNGEEDKKQVTVHP